MLKSFTFPILFLLNLAIPNISLAQGKDTISDAQIEQVAQNIKEKSTEFSEKINKATIKRLEAIQKQEEQLEKHLPKEELAKAKQLKNQLKEKVDLLNKYADSPEEMLKSLNKGPYLARFDSLETLLKFALPNTQNAAILKDAQGQLQKLQSEMGLLEEWESFLTNREQQWKELLSGNTLEKLQLPKAFGKWQEEAMAYKMQVQQWKETINDPQKIENEALRLLNKLPAFREFMSKNSELARLFGPPGGATNAPAGTPIPGLQTRQSLAQELQNRFGANALQNGGILQQQLQNGMDQLSSQQQNPLNNLVNQVQEDFENITSYGKETSSISPAQAERAGLKSKTFKQRIEFGWNMQNAIRIQDFPAVRDVGLSLGYKINPRSVIGVGVAYKFALGESWKQVEWTHEGIGLRSFLDWRVSSAGSKLLKDFWITGAFEMNYWSRIANNAQWNELRWEESCLVGITRIVKTNLKVAKKMKIQLLVDLTRQINFNAAQPYIFRIGISR
jgi:hypothetical protein